MGAVDRQRSWGEQRSISNCKLLEQHRRPRWRRSLQTRLRMYEIETLIEHRHGGPCDTDDGVIYATAAAPLIVDVKAIELWSEHWVPAVPRDALREIAIDALYGRLRPLSADGIALVLKVNRAERDALNLRTIGATDFGKIARAAERRRKARERAAKAYAPRPPRDSQEKRKPWKAAGISRATWFRRQAHVEVPAEVVRPENLHTSPPSGRECAEKPVSRSHVPGC